MRWLHPMHSINYKFWRSIIMSRTQPFSLLTVVGEREKKTSRLFFFLFSNWIFDFWDGNKYRLMIVIFWIFLNSRNAGDDVGLGTVLHRPVLMALEEEVTEDGMASTSSLSSSVQSPLKAIASVVFSSSSSSSPTTPHVNGKSSTMTTTPKPVKKDIYRADCQVDDAGRSGQSTADAVKINN